MAPSAAFSSVGLPVMCAAPGAQPGVTVAARSFADRLNAPVTPPTMVFAVRYRPMKGRNTTMRPPSTGISASAAAVFTFT